MVMIGKLKAHKNIWKDNGEVATGVRVEWGRSGDGVTEWLSYCVAGGI